MAKENKVKDSEELLRAISELEKEKDAFEAKVQAKFRYWLSERNVGDTGNLTKSLSIIKSKDIVFKVLFFS